MKPQRNLHMFSLEFLFTLLSIFLFSCNKDKKKDKNEKNNSEQQNLKDKDASPFFRCIENFPLFKSEINKVTDHDKRQLQKYLEAEKDDIINAVDGQGVGEKNILNDSLSATVMKVEKEQKKYQEAFFRWLKNQIEDKDFKIVVKSDYIFDVFKEQNCTDEDKALVAEYANYWKYKFYQDLCVLQDCKGFCDHINSSNPDSFKKNRRTLLLSYVSVALKKIKSPMEILKRLQDNFGSNIIGGTTISNEELLCFVFLIG